MNPPLLFADCVSENFLGLRAVNQVSLEIHAGEIVSVIGPNGAGKTTLFNLLTGQLKPSSGDVFFENRKINSLGPHQRAQLGMGRTFQIAKPLIGLSVLENVMMASFMRQPALNQAREKAMSVLETVNMAGMIHRNVGDLTLSQRRRLEVARALALGPKILLLDEVMAGLNQSEVSQSIELLQSLHAMGHTFLIIEHNLKVVRAFSKRVVVLDQGGMIADGSADDILQSKEVIKAYLGEGHSWK
ncbi:MAG: ABC transporter ATP-binding protein [Limnohabitans sp.]|nr:ABC transporter ATP-binding protein [Limnohabitans sp.]